MQPPCYFFILGRNPALSLAEIEALLSQNKYQIEKASAQAAIIRTTSPAENLMARLGGTIKIGKIIAKIPDLKSEVGLEALEKIIRPKDEKKFFFGLSAYALDNQTRLPSTKELLKIGLTLKRRLQEKGISGRYVSSREPALSSVIVKTNHLLDRGAEICLFFDKSGIQIGQTLAVQEFAQASFRDFGRPVHEMKIGLLPIQLTKILINLASQPLEATLLDPFCGFGTVLAEASLMGYQNLIGSDINPQTIEDTKKNLEWLGKNFKFLIFNFKLFQCDAQKLSAKLSPNSIDAIITEPYLGPTKKISDFRFQISDLTKELSQLYINAFAEFKKIIKPQGKVVIVFPAFKQGDQILKTSDSALPQIKKLGFQPIELLPTKTNSAFNIPNSTFSILYSRPDQTVVREIFVFEKT